MKGFLTSDHTPYVTLPIGNVTFECVVDTGFGGSLYLSEDRIAALRLPFLTSAPIVLADQSILIADVFEADLVWFSIRRRVTVIAGPIGCDTLIGMELLRGCRVELDDRAGKVRVQLL